MEIIGVFLAGLAIAAAFGFIVSRTGVDEVEDTAPTLDETREAIKGDDGKRS